MIDIKMLLNNPNLIKENAEKRFANVNVDLVITLYERLKALKNELNQLQQRSNKISKDFNNPQVDQTLLRSEAAQIKARISEVKKEIADTEKEYIAEFSQIPNMTSDDTPVGKTDKENVPLYFNGTPRVFDFEPISHVQLGAKLDILDFDAGAKVTGKKFYFLKNQGVELEMALIRLAIDVVKKHGFDILRTPELAKDTIITGSGFSPRGPETQIYSIENADISLIGTSEITIGGYLSGETFRFDSLPIKIAAISDCFRTEAGSYGKKSKGLYRVHQFSKVEMYVVSHPDESSHMLETILAIQEEFNQLLNIPYRVMAMCSGDLGAPAYKKYDIEAWMPSMNAYGEVTSTSNCTDYQARRLNIFCTDNGGKGKVLAHTLNGTAVATSRTLIAIIENNQQKDGSIHIPEALQRYTQFDIIK